MKLTYSLFKESNWRGSSWVIAAAKSSPFGRYSTATAARKDAREYKLNLERRKDLDSLHF